MAAELPIEQDEHANRHKAHHRLGDLNKALNGLRKRGLIAGYQTGTAGKGGALSIEVAIDKGSDQAEILRQVRETLPDVFSDAQLRTRIG